MSMIPMGGNVVRPNPAIVDTYPDYYLNMGLTAENLARKYEITSPGTKHRTEQAS